MATGRKLLLVKDIQMAQQKVAKLPPEDLSVVDELQPGTKLLQGQYTITRFLNNGGFGITYLAKNSLDRNVVIKECFPNAFCRRSKATVAARSRAHQSDLRLVVQLFVREAHNLAKIIHPNIVAVHQVFEDNGTAYMAIDYIDGLDLLEMIESKKNILSPDAVVLITEKMLSAVGFIHENNMLHRDISPDNILITMAGEPILIDFGAAREQASQKSRGPDRIARRQGRLFAAGILYRRVRTGALERSLCAWCHALPCHHRGCADKRAGTSCRPGRNPTRPLRTPGGAFRRLSRPVS